MTLLARYLRLGTLDVLEPETEMSLIRTTAPVRRMDMTVRNWEVRQPIRLCLTFWLEIPNIDEGELLSLLSEY